jgi:choline dehydrogenase-like flavoprotein
VRVAVIGAGSAGATIAARLSEHPEVMVELFEAGPDHRSADTPAAIAGSSYAAAVHEPGRTWPSLVAVRAHGQTAQPYLRGRGAGGSSAVNAMVALAGTPGDYDDWAGRHGCQGWSWTDVAPWFGRTALTLNRAPAGEWGALNRFVATVWPDAADGVLLTRDRAGRRVSVNDAYLEPARTRPNLVVHGDMLVERILVEGRRAVGVRVAGRDVPADLVVVSAGAIHSPALLLRSEIDVPGVGDGLCDHPSFPITVVRNEPADVFGLPIATVVRLPGLEGPDDLQILPMDHVDPQHPEVAVVLAAVMRVHSRGRVRLAAADAHVDPIVEFDMLSDDRDVAAIGRAIDALERLVDDAGLAAVGAVLPYDRTEEAIRARVGDYVHAAGTCAMGRVVDTFGRVVGYEGLMVCDASVMPALPRANTHLPTVMLAERLAALTLERLRSNGRLGASSPA